MPLKLLISPGGEKWYALAKKKLAEMKNYMRGVRLPAFTKTIHVGTVAKITLRSLKIAKGLSMDEIRITVAELFGGFVIYPAAAKLTAPFTAFSYFTNQELMPVKNVAIEAFSDDTEVSQKYRRAGETLVVAKRTGPAFQYTLAEAIVAIGGQATWDSFKSLFGLNDQQLLDLLNSVQVPTTVWGYHREQAFNTVSLPTLTVAYMPFTHSYVVDDETLEKVLLIQPHTNNPSVFEVGVTAALTSSGSATFSIDDISSSGRIGIGLSGNTKTRYDLDYALATPVVKSGTTLSGYGSESVVDSFSYVGGGNPPDTQTHDTTTTGSAVYPIAFGFNAASELQQVNIEHVYAKTGHRGHVATSSAGGTIYHADGNFSGTFTETKTIVLPNGVRKELAITATSITASGVYDVTSAPLTQSGSGTASFSQVIGTLEILYVDASLPAVIYRHVLKTYAAAMSVINPPTMVRDDTMTFRRQTRVVALIGTVELLVFELDETGIATDGATTYMVPVPDNITGGIGVSIAVLLTGYSTPTIGGSSNTTSIDANPETPVKAKLQVSPLAFAAQSTERYVGYYTHTDNTTHIFGSGTPRQALLNRLTEVLAAKETAVTITAEEQLFLNNIRAGTLTDYALKLPKASPFGISLI